MKRALRQWANPISSVLAALVLTVGLAVEVAAGNSNPAAAPPTSNAYGHSYGEWSAEWWKWWLSIPTNNNHPALGGPCGEGQSGKVFYLTAIFTGKEVACTIPAGKAVLVPIINVECSTAEDPPFHGDNEAELRACAQCWEDHVDPSLLEVTLDGKPLKDLASYRFESPLFSFDYPAANIFGIPNGPGTGDSVSDGYWLLLHPLSAGEHTLSFGGTSEVPAGACGNANPSSGTFHASYRLTVQGK